MGRLRFAASDTSWALKTLRLSQPVSIFACQSNRQTLRTTWARELVDDVGDTVKSGWWSERGASKGSWRELYKCDLDSTTRDVERRRVGATEFSFKLNVPSTKIVICPTQACGMPSILKAALADQKPGPSIKQGLDHERKPLLCHQSVMPPGATFQPVRSSVEVSSASSAFQSTHTTHPKWQSTKANNVTLCSSRALER